MAAVTGYAAYQNTKMTSVDNKRLVLMLYEKAISHLRLAREGLLQGNTRQQGEHLGGAIAVVVELYAGLDVKVKDGAVDFLRALYVAILAELPMAGLRKNVQTIDLAISYLTCLQDIWEKKVLPSSSGYIRERRRNNSFSV